MEKSGAAKMLEDATRIQLDLHAALKVDKITITSAALVAAASGCSLVEGARHL